MQISKQTCSQARFSFTPPKDSPSLSAATAILDRFLHHAQILAMNGRSYRLRHGGSQSRRPLAAGRRGGRRQWEGESFARTVDCASPTAPGPGTPGPGGLLAQSTDAGAHDLHSCNALPSPARGKSSKNPSTAKPETTKTPPFGVEKACRKPNSAENQPRSVRKNLT